MIRKMTLVAEWRMDCRKAGLEAGGREPRKMLMQLIK